MSKKRKRLVLLDAHSIIHRAYHALPDLSDSKGRPTGALYGLLSMLISIITELNPDYLLAAYDLPQKTHRHEIFKEYKAGRKKTDEALVEQLKRSRKLLKALNIEIFDAPGFEADDIIGTLGNKLKNDFDIVVASGDLDMLQLVDDKKLRVFTLKRSIKDTVLYDEDAVKNRYGFGPEFVVDYKALKGDPSDNISGVKGIGDKTATELIQKIGHIEDIYKLLEKNGEEFKKLGFKDRIIKLLKDGKEDAFFSKTLATIRLDAPVKFKPNGKTWKETVKVTELLQTLYDFDFRTLVPRFEKIFEDKHKKVTEPQKQIDTDSLEFKETAVALWLVRSDIVNPGPEDIYAFAGTKDFGKAKKIIFDTLEKRHLSYVFEHIERPLIPIIDKMNTAGIVLDIPYLKKLSKKYHKKLNEFEIQIYDLAGFEFNINSPKQLSEVLFDKLKIKPKSGKKTASGRPSTQEAELEKIQDESPIISLILSYRELQKLLSTYIDNLPKLVKKDGRLHTHFIQTGTTTGRLASRNPNLQNIPVKTELGKAVRTAFVAADNKVLLSCDYSQIELRIAAILSQDKKLIEIFKNGEDVHSSVASEIFEVDKNKVTPEMRRQAKVVNFGILYGMGINALKKNLGHDISTQQAREFLQKYFEKYKGLAKWIDETKATASRKGYTETLFGRRRYFEGIHSDLPYIRASAERMAINAPIQGTQADMIKIAMIKVDEFLSKNKFDVQANLILQIHDELIYEITENIADKISENIKKIMESALDGKDTHGVPIVVNQRLGKNWGEL